LARGLLPREIAMPYAEIPGFVGRCVLVLSAYALASWLGLTL
jgi:hypothetical protein